MRTPQRRPLGRGFDDGCSLTRGLELPFGSGIHQRQEHIRPGLLLSNNALDSPDSVVAGADSRRIAAGFNGLNGIKQQSARGYDCLIRRTKLLAGPINDPAHRLLERAVLSIYPRDTGKRLSPLYLPIDAVIVGGMREGTERVRVHVFRAVTVVLLQSLDLTDPWIAAVGVHEVVNHGGVVVHRHPEVSWAILAYIFSTPISTLELCGT